MLFDLTSHKNLVVKQVYEGWEHLGFETRNKYSLLDEKGRQIGHAAEVNTGFFGAVIRQFLGHWRKFTVHFYDNDRERILTAHHPFKIYFTELNIEDKAGKYIGGIKKRFSILTKRFDLVNSKGDVIFEVSSPIWKIWTFPFRHQGEDLAFVRKKWSGALSEIFTDRDNFRVEFVSDTLSEEEKNLILASSVYIDLMYFERKAGNN